MNAIEVKNITYSYDDVKDTLKDVSFNIEKGKYTTIIGHNGSGKSTMAKLIAGLLEKKSGSIKINDLEVNEENIEEIRSKLGVVFQNPDNQFIGSTVEDDIAFGLENHLVPQEKMKDIIYTFLKEVNLIDYLDKEPTSLSGGQKQRVAIAGVLAMKPEIIIFDEATSMLDPKGKKEIKELIKKVNTDFNITVVSITHDIEEVLNSDYSVVLNKGTIYKTGKPSEIFKDPRIKEIGLDLPFMMQIKNELDSQKIKVKSDDMEGVIKELCQLNSKH